MVQPPEGQFGLVDGEVIGISRVKFLVALVGFLGLVPFGIAVLIFPFVLPVDWEWWYFAFDMVGALLVMVGGIWAAKATYRSLARHERLVIGLDRLQLLEDDPYTQEPRVIGQIPFTNIKEMGIVKLDNSSHCVGLNLFDSDDPSTLLWGDKKAREICKREEGFEILVGLNYQVSAKSILRQVEATKERLDGSKQ